MKNVFCDWGTTNLRAYLTVDGQVLKTYAAPMGLRESRKVGFAKVMAMVLDHFQVPHDIPIRLSGMIGSKNGWREAPYATTPANADSILSQAVTVNEFPNLRIIGGVRHQTIDGRYDVMRGEEVQVLGLLQMYPEAKTICLPGTHSKWVEVAKQEIRSFSTWMTGDFFRCLSEHSIFQEQVTKDEFNASAFLQGVVIAESSEHMLNSVFQLRTDYLFGKVGSDQFHAYLSGFLIGHEIKAAAQRRTEIYLCGSDKLMECYASALTHFGIRFTRVDSDNATLLGMGCFLDDDDGT